MKQREKLKDSWAFVDDFLAALFVGPEHQRKGIGTRLLDVAKKIHPDMELSVYAAEYACPYIL